MNLSISTLCVPNFGDSCFLFNLLCKGIQAYNYTLIPLGGFSLYIENVKSDKK